MKHKGKAHDFFVIPFLQCLHSVKGKTCKKNVLFYLHVVLQLKQLLQSKSKNEKEKNEVEEKTGVDTENEVMERETDTDYLFFFF